MSNFAGYTAKHCQECGAMLSYYDVGQRCSHCTERSAMLRAQKAHHAVDYAAPGTEATCTHVWERSMHGPYWQCLGCDKQLTDGVVKSVAEVRYFRGGSRRSKTVSYDEFLDGKLVELGPPAALPPPAEPPHQLCAYAGKREERADLIYPVVRASMSESEAFYQYVEEERSRAQAQARLGLKRQLREWPTCKFGGEVTLRWAPGEDASVASWHCSHCQK